MLALAGYPLGIASASLDPAADRPPGRSRRRSSAPTTTCERSPSSPPGVDAVTYEFENVPVDAAAVRRDAACPSFRRPLRWKWPRIAWRKRASSPRLGHPHGRRSRRWTRATISTTRSPDIGLPAVLKTRRIGYDGKGQAVIRDAGRRRRRLAKRSAGMPLRCSKASSRSTASCRSWRARPRGATALLSAGREQPSRRHPAPLAGAGARRPDACRRRPNASRARCSMRSATSACWLSSCSRWTSNCWRTRWPPASTTRGHWTIEGAETSQFENHLRAVSGCRSARPSRRGRAPCLT